MMKVNIKYVDDLETLKRWNFKEPAIEFYNDDQHVAVPLSKVSGLQIKVMLQKWETLPNRLLASLSAYYAGERKP